MCTAPSEITAATGVIFPDAVHVFDVRGDDAIFISEVFIQYSLMPQQDVNRIEVFMINPSRSLTYLYLDNCFRGTITGNADMIDLIKAILSAQRNITA
ncbi:hypothetical protein CMI37_34135 [Candidatus Pacearchaeota archaeon]|nr:hypothetical protein [Candidatus Pacearchaeota archaeon]|tara:strand:+ start:1115 stop:1408 length:294 start_codon:yes stop_codon:yes gene_type:complete